VEKYLRFKDLQQRGLFRNRVTFGKWVRDYGFPPGVIVGNTRLFREAEVAEFLMRSQIAPRADRRRSSKKGGVR